MTHLPMKGQVTLGPAGEAPAGPPPPFIIDFRLVQGIGFKCMAYRDQDGIWREAAGNDELPEPLQILE